MTIKFSQPLLIVVLFRFNCGFAFLYFGFHNVSCFQYSVSELPLWKPCRVYFGERLDTLFSCVFYHVLQNMDTPFLTEFYFPFRSFHPPRAVSSVVDNSILHEMLGMCWEIIVQVRAWCKSYFQIPHIGSLKSVSLFPPKPKEFQFTSFSNYPFFCRTPSECQLSVHT